MTSNFEINCVEVRYSFDHQGQLNSELQDLGPFDIKVAFISVAHVKSEEVVLPNLEVVICGSAISIDRFTCIVNCCDFWEDKIEVTGLKLKPC